MIEVGVVRQEMSGWNIRQGFLLVVLFVLYLANLVIARSLLLATTLEE